MNHGLGGLSFCTVAQLYFFFNGFEWFGSLVFPVGLNSWDFLGRFESRKNSNFGFHLFLNGWVFLGGQNIGGVDLI